ncbi:MAG: hypothetical protein LBP65_01905 [Puniceicoccales bacterium]|jgi:hypothetical protein|nr:hypothetical protein [Puniceicoccales bacterium]
MAEFYQRRLPPTLSDGAAAGSRALAKGISLLAKDLGEVADSSERIRTATLRQEKQFRAVLQEEEKKLRRNEFQNIARQKALFLMRENPTDIDAFRTAFYGSMAEHPIPEDDRAAHETILKNVESNFYARIEDNRTRPIEEAKAQAEESQKVLHRSAYQNFVSREALAAYENNPEDQDAFRIEFRRRIAEEKIPSSGEVAEYNKIADRAEQSFYREISTNAARSLEQDREVRAKNEKQLRISNFENVARLEALAALQANPTDINAYQADFHKRMEAHSQNIPLDEVGEYGRIVKESQWRFYQTIAANQKRALLESLKYSSLQTANDFIQNGIRIQSGAVRSLDPSLETYENFTRATGLLMATAADGTPLFTPEEVADTTDGWTLQILEGRQVMDLSSDISLETLARMNDPNFDYAVTVENPTGEELTFRADDLSPERRNQFRNTSQGRIAALLKNESDAALLEKAQKFWRGEEEFLRTRETDKRALNLLAEVQVADNPIGPDNLKFHLENAFRYLDRFDLLPDPYARSILSLVNSSDPEACVRGATLLVGAVNRNVAAEQQLGTMAVLRAHLIYDQVATGLPAAEAVRQANEFLKPAGLMERQGLQERLKAEKQAGKFYAKDVTAAIYGYGGQREYQQLVDSLFLLSGGNKEAAAKTARTAIQSRYTETVIGADGRARGSILTGRRRFKNTPESVFGRKIGSIINEDLFLLSPEIAQKTGMPCDLDHLILVATPLTEAQIAEDKEPEWLLMRRNDDGTTSAYINPDTNQPYTYSLTKKGGPLAYARGLAETLIREAQEKNSDELLRLAPLLGDESEIVFARLALRGEGRIGREEVLQHLNAIHRFAEKNAHWTLPLETLISLHPAGLAATKGIRLLRTGLALYALARKVGSFSAVENFGKQDVFGDLDGLEVTPGQAQESLVKLGYLFDGEELGPDDPNWREEVQDRGERQANGLRLVALLMAMNPDLRVKTLGGVLRAALFLADTGKMNGVWGFPKILKEKRKEIFTEDSDANP